MPPAGKASMTGPAGNARPDDLADMQTTLSSLLIQKQNLENESRKVASKARNKLQIEQKQRLEM